MAQFISYKIIGSIGPPGEVSSSNRMVWIEKGKTTGEREEETKFFRFLGLFGAIKISNVFGHPLLLPF